MLLSLSISNSILLLVNFSEAPDKEEMFDLIHQSDFHVSLVKCSYQMLIVCVYAAKAVSEANLYRIRPLVYQGEYFLFFLTGSSSLGVQAEVFHVISCLALLTGCAEN